MRALRVLKQGVWYEIRTRINNREPLFRRDKAAALFARVFAETEARFAFEVRGLRLDDDRLIFYIKPEDGLELPAIMKWLKQTFAQRFNRLDGRIGHIWGDRYWSRILEGEPPVGEGGLTPYPGERALPGLRRADGARLRGFREVLPGGERGTSRRTLGSDPPVGKGRQTPRFPAYSPSQRPRQADKQR